MLGKRKKPLMMKVFVVFVSFAFTTVGFAARIIPTGKVSIIRDDKVIGEFSQEAPFPEGTLLRCEAQCTVRMTDAFMVAEPHAVFSVSPMAGKTELLVREGTVYFSINESSRPFQFNTPEGIVTTRQISLANYELMGYVRVLNQKAEVGVIAGGTMTVDTPKGEMAIPPEKQVTLARVDTGAPVSKAAGGQEEGISLTATDVILGVVGTAIIVGGIYGINYAINNDSSNGGGGGGGGSPSSP